MDMDQLTGRKRMHHEFASLSAGMNPIASADNDNAREDANANINIVVKKRRLMTERAEADESEPEPAGDVRDVAEEQERKRQATECKTRTKIIHSRATHTAYSQFYDHVSHAPALTLKLILLQAATDGVMPFRVLSETAANCVQLSVEAQEKKLTEFESRAHSKESVKQDCAIHKKVINDFFRGQLANDTKYERARDQACAYAEQLSVSSLRSSIYTYARICGKKPDYERMNLSWGGPTMYELSHSIEKTLLTAGALSEIASHHKTVMKDLYLSLNKLAAHNDEYALETYDGIRGQMEAAFGFKPRAKANSKRTENNTNKTEQ